MEIQRLETITRLGLFDCDLSPDGSAVAAVYQEEEMPELGVWSTTGCHPLLALDLPGAYGRPRFDPTGRRLAAAREGEQVTVWSLPQGEEILVHGRGAGPAISAHAFGPGGETIVVAQGGSLSIWRVDRGEWVANLALPAPVTALRSSRDGRLLGVGLQAGGVAVVDLEGLAVMARVPGLARPVTALSLHPAQPWLMAATGPSFATAGHRRQRTEHGWAYVWNYYTGEELTRVACDYQATLVGGGHYLATLTNNSRTLWIWQIPEARLAAHIEDAAPELMVDEQGNEIRQATLAATPQGDLLAVAGLTRPVAAVGVLRLFALRAEAVPEAQ